MKFVVRLEEGERMADLCREFGISRKTGYKLKKRYEDEGKPGLFDQSRRPGRHPNRTPRDIGDRVVAQRKSHPTWGPKKIRASLIRHEPEVRWPAASTIGVILKDAGLVDGRKRRRRAWPTPASSRVEGGAPNELWAIDHKGDFLTKDGTRCYPLTATDHFSRFLLGCEALPNTGAVPAAKAMENIFREFGLPERIRSDNGTPFASTGLFGLTQLSVWFMRLGIKLERIEPGHPEQNGRHERMHLTLKQDVLRPPADNILQQQEAFDAFLPIFNDKRPHESLGMGVPSDVYKPSPRPLPKRLPTPSYPLHDMTKRVDTSGRIVFQGQVIYVGAALIGQSTGLRQLDDDTWLLSFLDFDLGYVDLTTRKVIQLPQ